MEASAELAREKGCYTYFEGSKWQTGEYFAERHLTEDRWKKLAKKAKGKWNAKWVSDGDRATGSTSMIAGTTAGLTRS